MSRALHHGMFMLDSYFLTEVSYDLFRAAASLHMAPSWLSSCWSARHGCVGVDAVQTGGTLGSSCYGYVSSPLAYWFSSTDVSVQGVGMYICRAVCCDRKVI